VLLQSSIVSNPEVDELLLVILHTDRSEVRSASDDRQWSNLMSSPMPTHVDKGA
jgi:hypothetical protein